MFFHKASPLALWTGLKLFFEAALKDDVLSTHHDLYFTVWH